jgi:hypothetical protein
MPACDRLRARALRSMAANVGEDAFNRIGHGVGTTRRRCLGSHRRAQYAGRDNPAQNGMAHAREYNSEQMDVRARGRLIVSTKLVIALYLVAFAALPFAHHDFLCHVRSSTHCDVCHVGTSADNSSAHSPLTQIQLEDAGSALEIVADNVSSIVVVPSSGRSPPSAIVSL